MQAQALLLQQRQREAASNHPPTGTTGQGHGPGSHTATMSNVQCWQYVIMTAAQQASTRATQPPASHLPPGWRTEAGWFAGQVHFLLPYAQNAEARVNLVVDLQVPDTSTVVVSGGTTTTPGTTGHAPAHARPPTTATPQATSQSSPTVYPAVPVPLAGVAAEVGQQGAGSHTGSVLGMLVGAEAHTLRGLAAGICPPSGAMPNTALGCLTHLSTHGCHALLLIVWQHVDAMGRLGGFVRVFDLHVTRPPLLVGAMEKALGRRL